MCAIRLAQTFSVLLEHSSRSPDSRQFNCQLCLPFAFLRCCKLKLISNSYRQTDQAVHFVPCDRSPTKILLRDARSSPRRRLYWETGTVVLPHDPCGLRLSFPRRATRRALTPGSPCFCCFFIHLLQLLQACSLFIK